MPQQNVPSVENNFIKGLVTEFTGLNFPENAATDTNNCEFTIVGDVIRREGINNELNSVSNVMDRTQVAVSSYKWNNAGGDGLTEVVVKQVGSNLYFYKSSNATILLPLSATYIAQPSPVNFAQYVATGFTFDPTLECQFADGNGYLFVYHPSCDPFFCQLNVDFITTTAIEVKIRDFSGIPEAGVAVGNRPSVLTNEHLYNLNNQGWVKGNPWQAHSSSSQASALGVRTFTVAAALGVTVGDDVIFTNNHQASPGGTFQAAGSFVMSGTVTGYAGTTLTVSVTAYSPIWSGSFYNDWVITPVNSAQIDTWFSATGVYPSNADVWWYFKDSTGVFNPTTTVGNVTVNTGNAPRGHFILNAFNQMRTGISTVTGLTDVTTSARPRTGCWFQGRVWYTGVDAQQIPTGDAGYYTWTESIYFSQIVKTSTDFGSCYQFNDPTSEQLFDLLPTDGGVIQIQGCGSIYKLFPIQNGMLVFAANGIWFITGSQGIGFSANDYTITKISSVKSISSTSFVNVNGLPYFWNEEGIYSVQPSKNGGLEVDPITVSTILSFYEEIPMACKKYVRGDYHPVDYVIQWVYRSTNFANVTERYTFDKILNFNTYNKAFYPYTVDTSTNSINGVIYVASPGGSAAPAPALKYISSAGTLMTFAEEYATTYLDWGSINYDSFFVTGYKLHGQGQRRFQLPYLYVYSRADVPTSYKVQGLWDYASTGDSGRWSTAQLINNWSPNFGMIFRRHKIRGQGLVLQLKFSSTDGMPFDIMGWSAFETTNSGV